MAAYSSDAVYLFSTRDEPYSMDSSKRLSNLSRKLKRRRLDLGTSTGPAEPDSPNAHDVLDVEMVDKDDDSSTAAEREANGSFEEEEGEDDDLEERDIHGVVPIIHPRACFTGACNMETVKDGKWRC
jgi:hypothetical protein